MELIVKIEKKGNDRYMEKDKDKDKNVGAYNCNSTKKT